MGSRARLVEHMHVCGYEVPLSLQCLILSATLNYDVPHEVLALWLHWTTDWPMTVCFRVVPCVLAVCVEE